MSSNVTRRAEPAFEARSEAADGPRPSPTEIQVREMLAKHARISTPISDLSEDSDLHAAGLTSLATVGLMLALEERFDIEFPDSLLTRRTFSSIATLAAAVETLRSGR
jgi:acyl carrier protein